MRQWDAVIGMGHSTIICSGAQAGRKRIEENLNHPFHRTCLHPCLQQDISQEITALNQLHKNTSSLWGAAGKLDFSTPVLEMVGTPRETRSRGSPGNQVRKILLLSQVAGHNHVPWHWHKPSQTEQGPHWDPISTGKHQSTSRG